MARYCPNIPVQKNCTPLTMRMMHTRDGQPDTGSPNISFRMMMKKIIKKATTQKNAPMTEASISGTVENAQMPSREYRNSYVRPPGAGV